MLKRMASFSIGVILGIIICISSDPENHSLVCRLWFNWRWGKRIGIITKSSRESDDRASVSTMMVGNNTIGNAAVRPVCSINGRRYYPFFGYDYARYAQWNDWVKAFEMITQSIMDNRAMHHDYKQTIHYRYEAGSGTTGWDWFSSLAECGKIPI